MTFELILRQGFIIHYKNVEFKYIFKFFMIALKTTVESKWKYRI